MAKQPKKPPEKRGRGRPPGRVQDHQLLMRVSGDFLRSIDDWRDKQPDTPPRAEAIRRLIEEALKKRKPPQ